MEFAECVSFILIQDGAVLVEKRRSDKEFDPSLLMVPGGHMEAGEDQLETLARELEEELNIEARSAGYVCSLVHTAESDSASEVQRLHYYLVSDWRGDIEALEAEAVYWLNLDELSQLDAEPDRIAVAEACRLYVS
ncbi:MAG: NUDIX domain-containing protein [Saccharospirillaceae bacterium]|jgi:mutator protein MutT|nr:NUDIX domain-containing protein [Saccharospirillaceae bacterium]